MGLLGCYSNPEIQARLRQSSDKLDWLAASNVVPRSSARQGRKLRAGLMPKAIERVLVDSGEPMRARDIHAEVEEMLGNVGAGLLGQELAGQAGSDRQSRLVRLGRRRYRLA